jgi:pimeloyl-ACP methyl ester carboxylesterase
LVQQRCPHAVGAGVFSSAAGGAGWGGGSVFAPAAAANFRSNLMRTGNLSERELRGLEVPTLIITSAKDRMLPSIAEGE